MMRTLSTDLVSQNFILSRLPNTGGSPENYSKFPKGALPDEDYLRPMTGPTKVGFPIFK